MKKYLISIEKEGSPRLTSFFSQSTFSRYQSEFMKLGIRGADLSTVEYFKLAISGKIRPLSPGELGCTLSHIAAYNDFLESDEKYAIIFEDDVIQKKAYDLRDLEKELESLALSPGFLFSCGGIQLSYSCKVQGVLLKETLYEQSILKIHPYFYKNLSSTYAYIIDREMARILLDYHEQPRGCDHWADLANLLSPPKLYATYLFDHPEIDRIDMQSNIDLERQGVVDSLVVQTALSKRLYISFCKRILKLTLKFYPK